MYDIPGLREIPSEAQSQSAKKEPERTAKSSVLPKSKSKYSKSRSRGFDCSGWTNEFEDSDVDEELTLTGWVRSRTNPAPEPKWKPKPQWESYVSADVKSRCLAIKEDHELRNLRFDLGNRAITDVEFSLSNRSHAVRGNLSSTLNNKRKMAFDSSSADSDEKATTSHLLSSSRSVTKNPAKTVQFEKNRSLENVRDSLQTSKTQFNFKSSDDISDYSAQKDNSRSRVSLRRSSQPLVPPICAPIKYLEGSNRGQETRVQTRQKPQRDFYDYAESREPSPTGYLRQNSTLDIKNYRNKKQHKVVLKVKDFVAPVSMTTNHNFLHKARKQSTEDEMTAAMESQIYVQKYTDFSRNQKFLDPPDFSAGGNPVQFSSKQHNGEHYGNAETSEKPRYSSKSAPKAPVSFIHPDIASEQAALESLNLLQSLERKRRGRPIRTRLLGSEKFSCNSPDLNSRPFASDKESLFLGLSPSLKASIPDDPKKIHQLLPKTTSNGPSKLYNFTSAQSTWKL